MKDLEGKSYKEKEVSDAKVKSGKTGERNKFCQNLKQRQKKATNVPGTTSESDGA